MENNSISLMMLDVMGELIEKAHAARVEASRSGSDYDKGRNYALYEVISLLALQADAFGIARSSIGLEGVDPEHDFLGIAH